MDIPDFNSDKVEPTAEPSSRETIVCVQNGRYIQCVLPCSKLRIGSVGMGKFHAISHVSVADNRLRLS